MKYLGMVLLMLISTNGYTATANLSWDDNNNAAGVVDGYNVYVGTQSGSYSDTFDAGLSKTFVVQPLSNNALYYFAATAYSNNSAIGESGYSNEVNLLTPAAPPALLVVDFKASVTKGKAPLSINFTSILSGQALACKWVFGDGGTGKTCNPTHTYKRVGGYNVSLTATNAVGPTTITKLKYITTTRR